jgi:hypothetical protein
MAVLPLTVPTAGQKCNVIHSFEPVTLRLVGINFRNNELGNKNRKLLLYNPKALFNNKERQENQTRTQEYGN